MLALALALVLGLALEGCARQAAPTDSGIDSGVVATATVPPPPPAPVELACSSDADCVVIPSACCATRAANAAHAEVVRKEVAAADSARGNCKERVCAKQTAHAACDNGRCVVW